MDRVALKATLHVVAQWDITEWLTHTHTHTHPSSVFPKFLGSFDKQKMLVISVD